MDKWNAPFSENNGDSHLSPLITQLALADTHRLPLIVLACPNGQICSQCRFTQDVHGHVREHLSLSLRRRQRALQRGNVAWESGERTKEERHCYRCWPEPCVCDRVHRPGAHHACRRVPATRESPSVACTSPTQPHTTPTPLSKGRRHKGPRQDSPATLGTAKMLSALPGLGVPHCKRLLRTSARVGDGGGGVHLSESLGLIGGADVVGPLVWCCGGGQSLDCWNGPTGLGWVTEVEGGWRRQGEGGEEVIKG